MNKQDKITYVQNCIANDWGNQADIFIKNENVIVETDKAFFEITTFGFNAVIRADKEIVDWCRNMFSNVPANLIIDGENFYQIEKKLREHGKRLAGEHVRFLYIGSVPRVEKPEGYTFTWYEKEKLQFLYEDDRFDSALNYHEKGEVLALVARKDNEIVAVVAVDDYCYGLWQIGIDTLEAERGKGLAAYLIQEIARESEKRNQVPFYTTWSANLASFRAALKAGFLPVWVWYYAEDINVK